MSTTDEAYARLRDIYYNPITGFKGANKIQPLVPQLSVQQVRDWINNQETNQTFKEPRRVKNQFPITWESNTPFQRLQIDLVPMSGWQKTKNNGYDQFFIMIDTYSRFVFTYPLKSKNQTEVLAAFQFCLNKIKELAPLYTIRRIDSDQEKSFLSNSFQKQVNQEHIQHETNQKGDHRALAFVDRVIRSIRTYLNKYRQSTGDPNWVNVLPKIVQNYNENTVHEAIGTRPIDVVEATEGNDKLIGDRSKARRKAKLILRQHPSHLKKGDFVRVRISITEPDETTYFRKGTEQRFSSEVYPITGTKAGNTLFHVNGKWYRRVDLVKVDTTKLGTQPSITQEQRDTAQTEQRAHTKRKRTERRVRKEGIQPDYEQSLPKRRRNTGSMNLDVLQAFRG